MRVYTYARYSTDRQTEASIIDQQRRCHEYATRHGWRIAADFTDEGISGAAMGNRPGFQRAMVSLQAGDVLLVADLTRLSRSQELAPLLDRLRFRGLRVVGVLDGFDSDSPQARMQAGLSGLMSDEETRIKFDLVTLIRAIVESKKLRQIDVVALVSQYAPDAGVSQPDISRILRGNVNGYSESRLIVILAALGNNVSIVVEPTKGHGHISVREQAVA